MVSTQVLNVHDVDKTLRQTGVSDDGGATRKVTGPVLFI